jgi:hypothetical protein
MVSTMVNNNVAAARFAQHTHQLRVVANEAKLTSMSAACRVDLPTIFHQIHHFC